MCFIARIAALLLVLAGAARAAEGDAKRGAQLFSQCAACHSTVAGTQLTGPSLAHVWGRRAASVKGFERYSGALQAKGVVWNEATLERWLANPDAFVPGTYMDFPGVRDAQERLDIVAYLKAVDEGRAAPAAADRRPNLRVAPPEGQVRALSYCGDTYTVVTGDGATHKIWEFNLRLKSDSSPHGPAPGHPVALGAGMRGDRASIIFASPGEISAFIRNSCG